MLKSKNINVDYLTKDLKGRGNAGYPVQIQIQKIGKNIFKHMIKNMKPM